MSELITTDAPQASASSARASQPGRDERNSRLTIGKEGYVAASLIGGFAFVLLDMVLNANQLAQQALAVYTPVLRAGIDIVAAIAIDLVYGFALTAIFLVLYSALPGTRPVVKGLSFGVLLWFLRVLMAAAGQWILFAIPVATVAYIVAAGLAEMLLLGAILGLAAARFSNLPRRERGPPRGSGEREILR